jgi:iron only hydrogenase large subunit-like protein
LVFEKVVELHLVQNDKCKLLQDLKERGDERTWIASPCPTLVNMIRGKYPKLVENLVPVTVSYGKYGFNL